MRPATLTCLFVTMALIGCGKTSSADSSSPPPSASAPAANEPRHTDAAATSQPANEIGIENFSFAPAELTVPVGATVTWVNHDDVPHTATSTTKLFDSKTLDTDKSFSCRFTAAGTYEYFCKVHAHMTGKIVVR